MLSYFCTIFSLIWIIRLDLVVGKIVVFYIKVIVFVNSKWLTLYRFCKRLWLVWMGIGGRGANESVWPSENVSLYIEGETLVFYNFQHYHQSQLFRFSPSMLTVFEFLKFPCYKETNNLINDFSIFSSVYLH